MADLICSLAFLAALFAQCGPPPPLGTGYVEGEYVQIAPVATARVETLAVQRGDRVEAGQAVAMLESRDAALALAAARAAEARAASELANLEKGGRQPEIAAVEATLASARANAERAAREAARQERLLAQRVSSPAQRDEARAAADMAEAAMREAEARLAVARLPARPDAIAAARAALARARADRQAMEWQLQQRRLTAPASGTVTDILRHRGELAGPSAPVLSFLPEGAVTLRFYVAEADLAALSPGMRLRVGCDGCTSGSATVSFIADEAEFTPPVIYARDARQKLVYLVEARPDPGSALKPGQIVDVWKAP
ncbi:HlyD family efflux transporter periplasmic adaptor subunit (plasmid) [Paracoccus sp. MA]|uniref:HlyD family secretion protein n=1 Tax=Paracoccus sp. MA TaxID=2895796 RepID=UPI001E50BF64|nr:HlyD family efflux transporter periplasmic adaptor subunit [Paracoccus sp. MA]UFM66977.1 HlyD family efflux transporter periplasmic adaptor subunit [Paracoccus sp. MA]